MDEKTTSSHDAAYRFARLMIEQEWRVYDLRLAEKLAKEPVFVRYGEDGDIEEYSVINTKLTIDVEVRHV